MPPQVVLIIPGFNATNVSTSTVVQAGFDEDVINTDVGMTLRYGPGAGEAVDGIVTYDAPAHVATFTPTSPLVGNNVHTVTLSSLISDLSNNPLAPPFVWSFTTAPDDVEPIVLMTTPMNSATAVPVGSAITVVFNEPVQFFNSANVSVAGATPVTGTFSTAGPRTWVFTPDTDLPAASSINVSLASGIVDYSGNALATFSFSFTTQ